MPAKRGTLTQRVDQLENGFAELLSAVSSIESQQKKQAKAAEEQTAWLKNGLGDKIATAVNTNLGQIIVDLVNGIKPQQPSRRQITFRQVLEVTGVAVVVIGTFGILAAIFLGKMTADDAAKLITALRGGK